MTRQDKTEDLVPPRERAHGNPATQGANPRPMTTHPDEREREREKGGRETHTRLFFEKEHIRHKT